MFVQLPGVSRADYKLVPEARVRTVTLTVAVFFALPLTIVSGATVAQGTRVVITVLQPGLARPVPASSAAVCFSSLDNTKWTDSRGIVVFEKTPRGRWSAIGWKSGYPARRVDIAVPGTSAEVRATITLEEGRRESSPCVLPPQPAPSPQPSPNDWPPSVPGKVTIVVYITRASDRTPLQNAFACVGSDANHPASFAARAFSDANGRVLFHVDPAQSWAVTAGKSGFSGRIAYYQLPASATFGAVYHALSTGTGGPTCP